MKMLSLLPIAFLVACDSAKSVDVMDTQPPVEVIPAEAAPAEAAPVEPTPIEVVDVCPTNMWVTFLNGEVMPASTPEGCETVRNSLVDLMGVKGTECHCALESTAEGLRDKL